MPKKKRTKPKLQPARFIEAAKKSEVDETGEKFEQAFKKIATQRAPAKRKKWS